MGFSSQFSPKCPQILPRSPLVLPTVRACISLHLSVCSRCNVLRCAQVLSGVCGWLLIGVWIRNLLIVLSSCSPWCLAFVLWLCPRSPKHRLATRFCLLFHHTGFVDILFCYYLFLITKLCNNMYDKQSFSFSKLLSWPSPSTQPMPLHKILLTFLTKF